MQWVSLAAPSFMLSANLAFLVWQCGRISFVPLLLFLSRPLRKNAGSAFYIRRRHVLIFPGPCRHRRSRLLFVRPTTGKIFLSSFSVNCVNKYLPPPSPASSILFFKWFSFFPLLFIIIIYIPNPGCVYARRLVCVRALASVFAVKLRALAASKRRLPAESTAAVIIVLGIKRDFCGSLPHLYVRTGRVSTAVSIKCVKLCE